MRQSPSVCGRATSLRIEGHSVRAQHSSQRHHVCDGQHGPCTSLRQARARCDKANPQTTNEGHVTDMCEIGGDLQSQRDVHYEVKVPAPSQRRGRLGRARRHTADAVRHWATNLVSAAPSTKPCSRFLGAKSAATSHRTRSSMRPAKAGSKSTRDSTTTRSMSRTESSRFVSSKGAASRRQPRESSSTSPKRLAARAPSTAPTTAHSLRQRAAASARGFAQHHSQQLSRAAALLGKLGVASSRRPVFGLRGRGVGTVGGGRTGNTTYINWLTLPTRL